MSSWCALASRCVVCAAGGWCICWAHLALRPALTPHSLTPLTPHSLTPLTPHSLTPLTPPRPLPPPQSCGRRSLALRLLEEEASAAAQVPLLLSLAAGGAQQQLSAAASDSGNSPGGSEDPLGRALRKAVESGDPDLVHLVLFAAYKQRPLAEFWQVASARALARNLFAKYAAAKVGAGGSDGQAKVHSCGLAMCQHVDRCWLCQAVVVASLSERSDELLCTAWLLLCCCCAGPCHVACGGTWAAPATWHRPL
jgi:hypothetical protein